MTGVSIDLRLSTLGRIAVSDEKSMEASLATSITP